MANKVKLTKYPASGPIKVGDTVFENIQQIKEITCIEVPASKVTEAKRGELKSFQCMSEPKSFEGWSAARIYQRFPCFDAYDYASENRYFNNYILNKGQISTQLCKKYLQEIPQGCNYCMATLNAPVEYLPIVFHADEDPFVTVAEIDD